MALMSVFTAAPIFADPIISLDESGAGADFCDQFVGCRYNVSSSFSRGFFNSGELVLQDGPGGPILDILDFGLGVVGVAIFASDSTDGLDDPADVLNLNGTLPPPLAVIRLEAAPFTTYIAGPNDPGGDPFRPGHVVTWQVKSDLDGHSPPVPEPSSLLFLGSGLIILSWVRRRLSP